MERGIGSMFQEIKYYLSLCILILPIFIISLFFQMRLVGLSVECLIVYFFYMGLDTRDLVNMHQFEIRIKNKGDSNGVN